jgi:hypothetical protein
MTESIFENIQIRIAVGGYGNFLAELPDLSEARKEDAYDGSVCIGSTGCDLTDFADYYPNISKHRTPAAALRAFADRLDFVFGPRQREAMVAWQAGKFLGRDGGARWICEFGTEAAIAELDKEMGPGDNCSVCNDPNCQEPNGKH